MSDDERARDDAVGDRPDEDRWDDDETAWGERARSPEGEREGEDDAWRTTIVDGDGDGPTVEVGGVERAAEAVEDGTDGGNVAGEFVPETDIEPGTPDAESVAFVTVGAFLALVSFATLLGPPGGLGLVVLTVLAAVTGVVGGVGYLLFDHF
jgi:hypothetical protein